MTLPRYSTRQRKLLLDYLSDHPHQLLSAGEIARDLREREVSLSAVYRNLAQLEAEGKVRRCAKPGSRETLYQYTAAAPCQGALHMTCVRCGKTVHMAADHARLLAEQLARSDRFTLDAADTVLYGTCGDCAEKDNT